MGCNEVLEKRCAACERALLAHPINAELAAANARIAELEGLLCLHAYVIQRTAKAP